MGLRPCQPHTVDGDVDLLVVERDQVRDRRDGRQRDGVGPGEVGVNGVTTRTDQYPEVTPLYGQRVCVPVCSRCSNVISVRSM